MTCVQRSQRTFVGISALLFAGSAALTVAWCGSMAAVHEMRMPGGWTMSMMWMPMPGQAWLVPPETTAFAEPRVPIVPAQDTAPPDSGWA